MKKRTGLSIAGGILEIIAGVYWLSYSLFTLIIYSKIGNGLQTFDWVQLILPLCFIIFGIMAIIGKRKKDLVSFGVINLLFVAYIIYKACIGATTLSHLIFIILLFSGEIILLLISSFFFFFTKKSEYEIVFDSRYTEYVDNQPPEYKRLKKIYLLLSLALVLIISIFQIFENVGYIFIALTTIGFIVMTIILAKKNKTEYKLKVNIIASTIGLIMVLISSIYICFTFSKMTATINWGDFSSSAENIYLFKEFEDEKYVILIGRSNYDPVEDIDIVVYYGSNGTSYSELPNGAIQVITRYSCRYLSDGQDIKETYYKYFDANNNSIKYYYEQTGEVLDNLPQNKTIHFQTYKPIEKFLTIIYVFSTPALIILITKDIQFVLDVKKLLRQEEQQQTIDKYAKNQQAINLPPRPPKPPISEKSETQ